MSAYHLQLPYKIYQIVGNDALSFLQGQFTQDINTVQNDTIRCAAYCDHKAQMFANILIKGCANNYQIAVHSSVADTVIQRLKMFTLRSDVTITESEQWYFALNLQATEKICQILGKELPNDFQSVAGELEKCSVEVARLPNNYFILITDSCPQVISELMLQLMIDENEEELEKIRLQGGHFYITDKTAGMYQPQLTPLASWGISYHKGCYVGQEIISRSKYKSKVRQGLVFAKIDNTIETIKDVDYLTIIQQEHKRVGQVLDFYHGDKSIYCLAIVRLDSLEYSLSINDIDVTFQTIAI